MQPGEYTRHRGVIVEPDPRRTASATARYIAPVSRYSNPNRAASALVTVLFPTPDGPSMVTIISVNAEKRKVQSSE